MTPPKKPSVQPSLIPENTQVETEVSKLKQELETQKSIEIPFETLEKKFESNDIIKKSLTILSWYIEYKLSSEFNDKEKSKIKTVILWEIINNQWIITKLNSINTNVFIPINDSLDNETITQDKDNIQKWIKAFFDSLKGLPNGKKEIDEKIKLLEEKKKEEKEKSEGFEFLTLKSVQDCITGKITNKSEQDIFDEVKNNLNNWILPTLTSSTKLVENMKGVAKDLPKESKNTLETILKDLFTKLSKEYPVIWFILSFLFWDEFLNQISENSSDKKEKSLQNLQKFKSEKWSDFPLKEIRLEELKTLTKDDLKNFYEFLDSEEIDYSKDNFWEWLLTWKTKNTELKELHDLLLEEEGFEKLTLKELETKLNGLWKAKKEKTKNRKKRIAELKEKKQGVKKVWQEELTKPAKREVFEQEKVGQEVTEQEEKKQSERQQEDGKIIDQKPQQITSEEEEELNRLLEEEEKEKIRNDLNKAFDKSVANIKKLPAIIIDLDWKETTIDIVWEWKDSHIKIWDKEYKITITALGNSGHFKGIEFREKDQKIIINWDEGQAFGIDKITKVLRALLKGETYELSWSKNVPILGNVSYTWTISQIN